MRWGAGPSRTSWKGPRTPRWKSKTPIDLRSGSLRCCASWRRDLPDKQIANELRIAPDTVSKHVSNILAKMGACSRTEVSVRALQEGLVSSLGPALN